MKRFYLLMIAASFLLFSCTQKQLNDLTPYLYQEAVADSKIILPPPPLPGSSQWASDSLYYFETKEMREGLRGLQAIEDANMDSTVLLRFSEALGIEIRPKTMPATYHLLMRAKECFGTYGCYAAKTSYQRQRPFDYFGEASLTYWDDNWLKTNGSYPSGHSANYYGLSMILAALCPERQNELYIRAEEGAMSRVIAGCHWYSDIQAAWIVSATVFARLQADTVYQKDFKKAKREICHHKKETRYNKN